jgi:octaprenyl-diphosphate synthase
VSEVALHLVTAGGKRVRPRVVVEASKVGGRRLADVIELATAAELVHNASLLHDDVIDEAPLRRGRPSARTVWGNAHSVLAGDHLMASALEILESVDVPGVLRSMLRTMRRQVDAEVIQLAHRGKLLASRDLYDQVIRGKTASLFSWCADAGARAGGADEAICAALARYGEEVGVAFQVYDDLLDLEGTVEELGKSLFSDIAQGVATLPVVIAAEYRPELARELAEHAERGTALEADEVAALVDHVKRAVEETGAAVETRRFAGHQVDLARQALLPLEGRPERKLLDELAETMIDRRR